MGDNTTDVAIRFLTDADVPSISTFFEGLSEASRSFYHPYPFNQDAVTKIAGELHDAGCVHIGAFSDGKLVGHVWYRGGGEDGYPGLGVAVVDAVHNRGIGQKLMRQIEGIARERGERGLALTCYRKIIAQSASMPSWAIASSGGPATMSSFGWFAILLTMIRRT